MPGSSINGSSGTFQIHTLSHAMARLRAMDHPSLQASKAPTLVHLVSETLPPELHGLHNHALLNQSPMAMVRAPLASLDMNSIYRKRASLVRFDIPVRHIHDYFYT